MSQNKILKNSFYYMIAGFLPRIVGIITLPIYTQYLLPGDYGILALTQSFSVFLPTLLGLQIDSSLSRFYFDYKGNELKILITTITIFVLIISSCGLFILFIFLNNILSFVFPKTPTSFYCLFQLTLFTAFFNLLSSIFTKLLIVREKALLFMKTSISLFFLGLLISIYEVVFLKKGAYGVVEAGLIISIISSLIYFYLNYRYFCLKINFRLLVGPLKYSLPIIPHALAGIIFMYSDRIILEKYVSLSVIGLYSLSDRIAMMVKLFANKINTAFQPQFLKMATNDEEKDALKMTKKVAKITIFFISFFIATVSIFSVEILYYLINNKYYYCWKIIPLLSSAYIFRSLYCFTSTGLFYKKETGKVSIITITAGLINIVINILYIPKYGMIVAVWSTIIAFIITYIMSILLSIKSFKIELDNISNFVYIGSVYLIMILSYYINLNFLLNNYYFPISIYILKLTMVLYFLFLGYKTDILSISLLKKIFYGGA